MLVLAAMGCEPPTTDETGTPTRPTDPCAPDPALSVVSVTPIPGYSTMLDVEVALSAPASAAVQCTSDTEPDQVFFAESTVPSETHTLRLWGLIPNMSWSCTAAPICPRQVGPAARFAHRTDVPPIELRSLDVDIDPVLGMDGPWTLAPFQIRPLSGQAWLVVWGPDGRVRWWWPLPGGVGMWIEARWHGSDGKFVWGGGMENEGRVRFVDPWDGETYALAPPGWQQEEFHHDGKRIDDGRVLTLELRENAAGDRTWDGFGIRIFDPVAGTQDFEFDSQTLVDAGLLEEADGIFDRDPYHANWVDWQDTPTGPIVYASLCYTGEILAIDAVTGDLSWKLGRNLGWTLLDETGAPLGENWLPQCQHGLEVDGDRLLIYDNAQDRNRSSVSEWRIDAGTRTATRLWIWDEAGWQEDYLGDVDYLPNGRILVTQAAQSGVSEIVEVDLASGDVASRLKLDTGGYTYRSERYDGCDLFTSVRECDTLATRFAEVAPLLEP